MLYSNSHVSTRPPRQRALPSKLRDYIGIPMHLVPTSASSFAGQVSHFLLLLVLILFNFFFSYEKVSSAYSTFLVVTAQSFIPNTYKYTATDFN